MLQCRKISSWSSWVFRSDHVSAPQSNRFIGMARKSMYLLNVSRWGFRHISFNAPIAAVANAIRAVMLSSLQRLFDEGSEVLEGARRETNVSIRDREV